MIASLHDSMDPERRIAPIKAKDALREFDRIGEFLSRCGWKEKLMAFLEGYFDESGTHETASHLVVSGFIAEADQWRQFVEQWAAALKDQGMPRFKAQWFDKRREFFGPWGDDEVRRKGFMARLIGTIERLKPTPVSFAIPAADYEEIISTEPVRTEIGSAYTLCAMKCLSLAGTWARSAGYTEPINYYFDAGHRNAGEFLQAHQKEWNNPESRKRYLVGQLTFADDEKILPLQAADLIAYEMAQYLSGKTKRHPLKEMLKLDSQDGQFDRAALIQIRNRHCPEHRQ